MDVSGLKNHDDIEREGVWFEPDEIADVLGDPKADFRLKLARFGNKGHQVWQARRARRVRGDDLEASRKITNEGISKFVLKSWQNITKDGKPLMVSEENALMLLNLSKDLADLVISLSSDRSKYQPENGVEETVKN